MSAGTRRLLAAVMVQEVVKAEPGYFILSPIRNEVGTAFDVLQSPVVAWALERDTYQPYPIGLNGLDVDTPTVLRSDGKVERLGQETFPSLADWLADLQRQFPKGSN